MQEFEAIMRKGGAAAIAEATRFFMKDDRVHRTLYGVTRRLRDISVPYAVAGGMALVAHGYDRTTEDVHILVDASGLAKIQAALDGLGYVPAFAGSKNLRDTSTAVRIEFLISGQFPGDGKPKPVAFPNPIDASIEIDGIFYLRLPMLVELKLASGMSNVARAKDIGDVVEIIRLLKLPMDFRQQLNPYVREKFTELWTAVDQAPAEE